MPNPNDPQDPPCPPGFEKALVDLELVVRQLEDGDIGLAEALSRYEQAIGLLKTCYGLLEQAERRIELLSGVDASGAPVTAPFDDRASFEAEEKPAAPARRRKTVKGARGAPHTDSEPPHTDIDELGGLF